MGPVMTPEPGVYSDIPEPEYHGDRGSLSVSAAKLLVPPSVPAAFKWQQDNGRPDKKAFDMGHAAHARVLGVGQPIRYIQANDWRTKAAQEAAKEARAVGEIPLLEEKRGVIEGMEAAIRAHRLASVLLDPEHGKPEQSLYAIDPTTGVKLRGRLDWLPAPRSGRLIIPDYKTADSATKESFGKSAANYLYCMQDPWYRALVKAVGLDDNPAFLFIVQEKNPPFLVNVIELDAEAVELGQVENRKAIDLYSVCQSTNQWPGYDPGVSLASLPVWFRMQRDEMNEDDAA